MKVLVTGGLGFIGSNIVEEYLKKGYEVVVVDNLSTGSMDNHFENVKLYEMDICSEDFLKMVEDEKPDVINHHAAQIDVQTSISNPLKDAKVNVLGTLNILEACRINGCRLIYPSSAAIYGTPEYLGIDEEHPVKPISNYGISKHTPEHYIQAYHQLYGVEYTIFRYANVYGPRQDPKGEGGVISILVDCFLTNKKFTVFGNGEQTRDFIYVSDLVKANMIATEQAFNDIFNISTGIQLSLNEIITIFKSVLEKELAVKNSHAREGDIKHSFLLNEKAKNKIGWTPKVKVEEGFKKTFRYYDKN